MGGRRVTANADVCAHRKKKSRCEHRLFERLALERV
tara:strand:+ start:111 stop:218 length:108 start_codon:yes stop_codon:yes gene_type:complete